MKSLIINLGPGGDVVRTTVLNQVLEGEVYWLTTKKCSDLLKSDKIKKVFYIDDPLNRDEIKKIDFDLIVSLNEELEALEFLKDLKYKKLIGCYLENGKVNYTPESSYWFDMSLSSRFGKEEADKLKMKNKKSLPQILVEMLGNEWKAQEYNLGYKENKAQGVVGLINTIAGKWPNKDWKYYPQLKDKLEKSGYIVKFLDLKPTIREHIEDINSCELIVCGDTMGMHIALALKKKVIVLFNCTSPDEIYDYGRMKKIVSPSLEKYYYKKEFNEEAISAIKLDEVYKRTIKLLNS